MPLRIGTSGWNYPTGKGTWNGIFYPLPEDRERGFDELRFYSERFNTVEVNSTFYGQPRASAALGWVKRTPKDFEFTVKLYQKFTHPGMTIDRTPVSQADVDAFKGGIERSEERRVGKECRSRRSPYNQKNKAMSQLTNKSTTR